MHSTARLFPFLSLLVAPLPVLAQVATSTEIHLTADLDGDGREDTVVIDRASGGFRAAYQGAPGVWSWAPARATGIASISAASIGRWFDPTRDALAVTAPAANRAQIIRAASAAATPTLTPVFTPGLGPSAVASPDIGGPGNTAHPDLWLASVENGAPIPIQLGTVRHNGALFTPLLQSPSTRNPTAVRTTALKVGGPAWVAFLGTAPAQPDQFTVLSYATGAAAQVVARAVPIDSAWASGLIAASSLHHVLTWVPGQTSFLSHALTEGPPSTFGLAAAVPFDLATPIGRITVVASAAGARLVVTAPNGSSAKVYAFDGTNPPALLQTIAAPNGQSFNGLLPLTGGGFQLLQGQVGIGITSTMIPFTPSGGLFVAGAPSPLPALRTAALRANVFGFSTEPFVDPAARLLARYNAPEWSSLPILLGNQLSVSREIFGGASFGLGGSAPLALGSVPMGTAFTLTNQFGAAVSLHSYDAGDGAVGADASITPIPGPQIRAVRVAFAPSPPTAPVFFKLDNGPWTPWADTPVLVMKNTTVTFYARDPNTQQPSALRTARYTFEVGPFELDSDGDGVPDFVENHLSIDPLAGTDTDGDGFSDLTEILLDGVAINSEFTPPNDARLEDNIAFKLRVAPRPIDGTNGARAQAALGINLQAHGLDGALLATGQAVPLATPGIIGAGLSYDAVVADELQALFSVLSEAVFTIATVSPDKNRGREIGALFLIPAPAPPVIAYTSGGGAMAAEVTAWIAAASAAYANQLQPTVAGNWTEIDTLTALLLEWKIEQILLARGVAGLTPGKLTLFGGRLGDAGRFTPSAADLAALRLRASASLPGYDLTSVFTQLNGTVSSAPALSVARAAATAIYRTSSAQANSSPPGTWLPPFDVLRAFVRGTPLPAPYAAAVGIAAPDLTSAQNTLASLVSTLPSRPVQIFTLWVGPDSFAGSCHALTDSVTAEIVNLFSAPGFPYQPTDGFALIPGTKIQVLAYSDLVGPCSGTNVEVIRVDVISFPPVPFTDSNQNLLPDDWEWALLPDGGGTFEDDDGDGISNVQEYLDGTDPLDFSSKADTALLNNVPQLKILQDGYDLVLLWAFPATYADAIKWTLETSPNLIDWTERPDVLAEQIEPGIFQINLPNAIQEGEPKHFHRVIMGLKP